MENDFLHREVSRRRPSQHWWFGYHDIEEEGAFVWLDGSPSRFTHWSPGTPEDGGRFKTEDCAELGEDGLWNDEDCRVTQPFVCELESARAVSAFRLPMS